LYLFTRGSGFDAAIPISSVGYFFGILFYFV